MATRSHPASHNLGEFVRRFPANSFMQIVLLAGGALFMAGGLVLLGIAFARGGRESTGLYFVLGPILLAFGAFAIWRAYSLQRVQFDLFE